jgi:protein-tyrosine-phosphatase
MQFFENMSPDKLNILYVCRANLNRSVCAEIITPHLLRNYFSKLDNIENTCSLDDIVSNIKIDSAGISNARILEDYLIGMKKGFSYSKNFKDFNDCKYSHKPKNAYENLDILDNSDIIFCISNRIEKKIRSIFSENDLDLTNSINDNDKIYCLPHYVGSADNTVFDPQRQFRESKGGLINSISMKMKGYVDPEKTKNAKKVHQIYGKMIDELEKLINPSIERMHQEGYFNHLLPTQYKK